MNAVVSMQAMAKVAWEVIDGVRGGRRKNEEESSYKVPQAKSCQVDPKQQKPKVKSKTILQRKARGEGCNKSKCSTTGSLTVKKAESQTRGIVDDKPEKRKADKVTIFSKENEINAPSCGHGITKLASTFHTPPTHIKSSKMLKLSRTTMACAPVIRARIITTIQKIPDPLVLAHCVDHSSDLATTTTTELWNSKDKGPHTEENRKNKRLRFTTTCSKQDDISDSLAERDEKDFIKSLRRRRVLEQLERAEALEFKAKVERMLATNKIFGNGHRNPEQIAHDVEIDRFECAIIHVYTDEEGSSSCRKAAASGGQKCRVHSLMDIIEDETTSDILDNLLECSNKGFTERRGGGVAPLGTTTTSLHQNRLTRTDTGVTTCPSGPESMHDVSHCSICIAGVQLKPSALLHQLKENHSMAHWTPPFVRITATARQEGGVSEAERCFIDAYRQAYANGLLRSPPDENFMRRTRGSRTEGENRGRQRGMRRAKQSSSVSSLSAADGPNIGGGGDILRARRHRRVGREGNSPYRNNNQTLAQEEGRAALLHHPPRGPLSFRTRRAVRALQEEERVKEGPGE